MATYELSPITSIICTIVYHAKKHQKQTVLQKALKEMRSRILFHHVIEMIGVFDEQWAYEAVLTSGILSSDLAYAILERSAFNERLCEIALRTYAGKHRLRNLLFTAIEHQQELSNKLEYIERTFK